MRITSSLVAIIFGLSMAGSALAADMTNAPAGSATTASAPAKAKTGHVKHVKAKKAHHKASKKAATETAK